MNIYVSRFPSSYPSLLRVFVASLFAQAAYSPFKAYGRSKLANVLFTRALARRMEDKKVYANVCHPGGIHTNLGSSLSPRGVKFRSIHGVADRPVILKAK